MNTDRSLNVSVALATYNGARYLREQLDSIAQQTLLPFELVVSDDGSKDETLTIVRDFAKNVPFPVRILEKDRNLGFADNFLFCASQCKGDLIAFCDQDDVWLPEKLKLAHDRMLADGSLLSIHPQILVDGELHRIGEWPQDITHDEVVPPLTLDFIRGACGNTLMIRAELARDIPYANRPMQPEEPGKKLAHDTWFFVLACALGTVSRIAKPLILYRQHGANVYGVAPRTWKEKLQQRLHVDMTRIKERCNFYRSLIHVFADLSENPEFAKSAQDARKVYTDRMIPLVMMIQVYEAATLKERWSAFRRLYFPKKYTRDQVDDALRRQPAQCSRLDESSSSYEAVQDNGHIYYAVISPEMARVMRRGSLKSALKDFVFGVLRG